MEPSLATGASIVQAVPPTAAAMRAAVKKLRLLGTYEVDWLALDAGSKGERFSAAEAADIGRFLSNPDMAPLLSLLAVTLLAPDVTERAQSIALVGETFTNNVKRWTATSGGTWKDRAETVWTTVLGIYDEGTPRVHGDIQFAAQEFGDFLRNPLAGSSQGKSGTTRYLERLRDLAADLGRVAAAIDVASEIRAAIADAPIPPIITYTQTAKTATFEDLYISRSLVDKESDTAVGSAQLGAAGGPFRVVVQGAPGAGKSTFVRHLRRELAQNSALGQAALLITVRHYFTNARAQTLHEYLFDDTRASLNLEFDAQALRDALTLGHFVVIFDGLDEITDINLRADMVGRIVSFGREYPATSILVTSRAIGYDRAPLPPKTFSTLALDQYNPRQSEEYVDRWFKFIEREDLISEFARESQTVTDLKANPLLLSLLCVLYRERGSIPRRRRDIYANCADLLFHTWDSHRHIGQPEELHANGDRIMQEIARWVYQSQAAQSGLSESVIQKVIGTYLKDTVGVEEGEARRRAGEFLEFCATRAWLLANIGNQYGERVFGFTHRTFFEYFAAEAFARQSSDPEKVAELITKAHERDATSVLPELLLQAFDEKVDRGAAAAFQRICAEARDEVLILRLMEGVPLPSRTRAIGFARVMELWRAGDIISESSFGALLALNRDARHQFIADHLSAGSEQWRVALFVKAWAALELSGRALRHHGSWLPAVIEALDHHWPDGKGDISAAVTAWLWLDGRRPLGKIDQNHLFHIPSVMGDRVGYLWLAVEKLSRSSESGEDPDLLQISERVIAFAKRPRTKLPYSTGSLFEETVSDRLVTTSLGVSGTHLLDGPARWLVLYTVAIMDEAGGRFEPLDRALYGAFGSDPGVLLSSRAAALDVEEFPTEAAQAAAAGRVRDFPVWLRNWAKGSRSFISTFGQ